MTNPEPSEAFVTELRTVLQHLYDPATLNHTGLVTALAANRRPNPARALRQTLLKAVEMLKPGDDVPLHSNTWRVYHILTWRYVEQSPQDEVAASLAVSPRQLRRLEWMAVRALADYLWQRYNLEEHTPDTESTEEDIPGRQEELNWVKESFPSNVGNVAALLEQAVQIVAPLAQATETRLTSQLSVTLPPVAGQLAALRQGFISVLTAAIYTALGGEVHIKASASQSHVQVVVRAGATQVASSATEEVIEHLKMARQCLAVFGGVLDVLANVQGQHPFIAKLRLPVAEQATVMVIDDNADVLQLLERYLSGTSYRFYGTRDPQKALALAEEHTPAAIVLDIMLPEVDGWELLGRLREHPQLSDVPLIVCTILPQERLALTLGASGFLRKPVNREQFVALLDQLLRK